MLDLAICLLAIWILGMIAGISFGGFIHLLLLYVLLLFTIEAMKDN